MKKLILLLFTFVVTYGFSGPKENTDAYSKFFGEGKYKRKNGNIYFTPKAKVLLSVENSRHLQTKIKRNSPQPPPINLKVQVKEPSKLKINSKVTAIYKIENNTLYHFGEGFYEGFIVPPVSITACLLDEPIPVEMIEIDKVTKEGVGKRFTVYSCELLDWGLTEELKHKYKDLAWEIVDIEVIRSQ